ncbi:MAG: dockerin type I repeat-containing protein, partial [Oscillospiraceae bacterium]|nr:dockerin type I repeat-containing protein [Oscillospiraceae bacterium]
MKKHNRFSHGLAGIIAAGAMCAALPILSSSAALTGDVDLSGKVDVLDVITLHKYLLNKQSISKEAYLNADATGDGVVNIFDLMAVTKQVVYGTPEQPEQPTETETEAETETETTTEAQTVSDGTAASIVYNGSSVALYDIN